MSVWGSEEEKRKFAIGAVFGSEFYGLGGGGGSIIKHDVMGGDGGIVQTKNLDWTKFNVAQHKIYWNKTNGAPQSGEYLNAIVNICNNANYGIIETFRDQSISELSTSNNVTGVKVQILDNVYAYIYTRNNAYEFDDDNSHHAVYGYMFCKIFGSSGTSMTLEVNNAIPYAMENGTYCCYLYQFYLDGVPLLAVDHTNPTDGGFHLAFCTLSEELFMCAYWDYLSTIYDSAFNTVTFSTSNLTSDSMTDTSYSTYYLNAIVPSECIGDGFKVYYPLKTASGVSSKFEDCMLTLNNLNNVSAFFIVALCDGSEYWICKKIVKNAFLVLAKGEGNYTIGG